MYCNFAVLKKIKLENLTRIVLFEKKVFWTKNVDVFRKNMDFFLRETWQQTCSRFSRKSSISKKVFLTIGFFAEIWFCDQTAFPLCCKNTFLANLVSVKYSSASGRLVNVRFWKKIEHNLQFLDRISEPKRQFQSFRHPWTQNGKT